MILEITRKLLQKINNRSVTFLITFHFLFKCIYEINYISIYIITGGSVSMADNPIIPYYHLVRGREGGGGGMLKKSYFHSSLNQAA